jgi:DNA-directed RNA polymerase subunit RPC12/RpoP
MIKIVFKCVKCFRSWRVEVEDMLPDERIYCPDCKTENPDVVLWERLKWKNATNAEF